MAPLSLSTDSSQNSAARGIPQAAPWIFIFFLGKTLEMWGWCTLIQRNSGQKSPGFGESFGLGCLRRNQATVELWGRSRNDCVHQECAQKEQGEQAGIKDCSGEGGSAWPVLCPWQHLLLLWEVPGRSLEQEMSWHCFPAPGLPILPTLPWFGVKWG